MTDNKDSVYELYFDGDRSGPDAVVRPLPEHKDLPMVGVMMTAFLTVVYAAQRLLKLVTRG